MEPERPSLASRIIETFLTGNLTPLVILLGLHNRPPESYTPLVLLRWLGIAG